MEFFITNNEDNNNSSSDCISSSINNNKSKNRRLDDFGSPPRDEVLSRPPLTQNNLVAARLSPVSPTSVCDESTHDESPFCPEYKARRRGSARSVSSSMTDWSTSTAPASNTTQSQEEKKRQKGRFMKFANVLLQFLERKDPDVYVKAQTVIRDCEEKKRTGQVESFSESVKAPLKDLVGPSYWKQARKYSKRINIFSKSPVTTVSHDDEEAFEPLSPTEEPPMFSRDELACLEQSLNMHEKNQPESNWMAPLSTKSCTSIAEELKIRKERFWLLIRVLMKYLERTEPSLFRRARAILEDCIRRHKKRRERACPHLIHDVQKRVKELVGIYRWRRAEAYLAKVLLKRANEEELEAAAAASAKSKGKPPPSASSKSFSSEYDLEITDDSIKSFGWGSGNIDNYYQDESLSVKSPPEYAQQQQPPPLPQGVNHHRNVAYKRTENLRSMYKKSHQPSRSRENDRFSFLKRTLPESQSNLPILAANVEKKRRRVRSSD